MEILVGEGGGKGRLLNGKRVKKKFQWVRVLIKVITILVGGTF